MAESKDPRKVTSGFTAVLDFAGLRVPSSLCISYWPDKFCKMIPALLLVFSAVVYRVTTGLLIHSGASWLSNFAPLAAIALCSAAYFPNKYKFSVPLVDVIHFRRDN